ncbi:MAG: VPGUxxT family thioredoxin-like (seleno)protein, type 2 [Deltaproteobacteria bacterium]
MRVLVLGLATSLIGCTAAAHAATPPELGDVAWLRDYDQAKKRAKAEGKPILILFDEVPGCQTCVRYGQSVLRHPLIVEAAETEFVPVAIYNNVGGKDRAVLKKYKEPTWNNPVVRIVDAEEKALTPRLAGDYSRAGLVRAMITSLEKLGRPVPQYLTILAAELGAQTKTTARAVFSMYCFWSGEACLGNVDGVVASRTGFLNGSEVVEITYDPAKLSYDRLVAAAKRGNCASRVLARNGDEAKVAAKHFGTSVSVTGKSVRGSEKDDKYQLRHTLWRFVPMTDLQASRANSMVGRGQDPSRLFSPQQRALFAKAKKKSGAVVLFEEDLVAAFEKAERALN